MKSFTGEGKIGVLVKLNWGNQAKTGEKFHWKSKNGILVKLNGVN